MLDFLAGLAQMGLSSFITFVKFDGNVSEPAMHLRHSLSVLLEGLDSFQVFLSALLLHFCSHFFDRSLQTGVLLLEPTYFSFEVFSHWVPKLDLYSCAQEQWLIRLWSWHFGLGSLISLGELMAALVVIRHGVLSHRVVVIV